MRPWFLLAVNLAGFVAACVLLPPVSAGERDSAGAQEFYYAGVVEKDKGEGVYVLTSQFGNPNFPAHTEAWGGMIAEFIRRHPDRRIVTIAPGDGTTYGNAPLGYIIITVPKK